MQHITDKSFVRQNPETNRPEVLIFSITTPGWKNLWAFDEVGLELSPGRLACPKAGCKVYKYRYDDTHVVFHNKNYGCPDGFTVGQKIS